MSLYKHVTKKKDNNYVKSSICPFIGKNFRGVENQSPEQFSLEDIRDTEIVMDLSNMF